MRTSEPDAEMLAQLLPRQIGRDFLGAFPGVRRHNPAGAILIVVSFSYSVGL